MRNKLGVIAAGLLISGLLGSCSSSPVREKPVQKLDTKILEEFEQNRDKGDFYLAGRSFIEFINTVDDERKHDLVDGMVGLYEEKAEQLLAEGRELEAVEHTWSLMNLLHGEVPGQFLNPYRERLNTYLESYLEKELSAASFSDSGDLERASRIMYLARFSEQGRVQRELAALFLDRSNPILAARHLDLYAESLRKREGPETLQDNEAYQNLSQRLEQLRKEFEETSRNPVAETVNSSVKIVVDKGIRTERGVSYPEQALGSGIAIDQQGYIITNHHIIESNVDPAYEGYSRVYVKTGEREDQKYVAKVVGHDPVFDLALLKVEKELVSRVIMGDSDMLVQGETVLAIGNPVGLTNSVTSGIVSSIDRPFLQLGGIIQIDAALNPGNSGGALINREGYLVGITFAGLENFENLNFAIPSRYLLSELHRLYQGGTVKRSWAGCSVTEVAGELSITYVVPNSPAVVCGLRKGDVIREVNGRSVSKVFEIQETLAGLNSPVIVNLTIERGARTLLKKVYLAERPVYPSVHIYDLDAERNIITPLFGIVLSAQKDGRKDTYVISKTLQGSAASQVGITEGDEIKLREIEYDRESDVFYLVMDLKSKRFGYLSKSMILYQYVGVSSFI